MGTSPIYDAVYRAPWGRRCGYHRAQDAEKLGIDVMAQLKASVLKAQGRQDSSRASR